MVTAEKKSGERERDSFSDLLQMTWRNKPKQYATQSPAPTVFRGIESPGSERVAVARPLYTQTHEMFCYYFTGKSDWIYQLYSLVYIYDVSFPCKCYGSRSGVSFYYPQMNNSPITSITRNGIRAPLYLVTKTFHGLCDSFKAGAIVIRLLCVSRKKRDTFDRVGHHVKGFRRPVTKWNVKTTPLWLPLRHLVRGSFRLFLFLKLQYLEWKSI